MCDYFRSWCTRCSTSALAPLCARRTRCIYCGASIGNQVPQAQQSQTIHSIERPYSKLLALFGAMAPCAVNSWTVCQACLQRLKSTDFSANPLAAQTPLLIGNATTNASGNTSPDSPARAARAPVQAEEKPSESTWMLTVSTVSPSGAPSAVTSNPGSKSNTLEMWGLVQSRCLGHHAHIVSFEERILGHLWLLKMQIPGNSTARFTDGLEFLLSSHKARYMLKFERIKDI